jgi:transcriptional regulator of arginine metabolism
MVAAVIDRSSLEGVAGTVAGDDTILMVCRQGVLARRVERRMRALADMLLPPEGIDESEVQS